MQCAEALRQRLRLPQVAAGDTRKHAVLGVDDRRYQKMEETLFGTVALPYYAVMSPEGKPVVTFGGLTRNPDEYLNFLRTGLQ